MYSPHPSMPYAAFRQACRAFAPSSLVRVIARVSASLGEPPYSQATLHRLPPWGLAAMARESLVYGNEHRATLATQDAVLKLCREFQETAEPAVMDDPQLGSIHATVTRLAHEQFGYHESMFEELSRSHAWFVESLPEVDTKVITPAVLDRLLGIPFRQAVGATFFLTVGALQNHGMYRPSWLDQPNFAEVLKVHPRESIERIAARLTTTPEGIRADYLANRGANRLLDRFDYNPLVRFPFVDMGDGMPVAPATRLILRTVTPAGLYHAGIAEHGHLFANDLGLLLEHYVGRQLRLIDRANVRGEIVYGKPEKRSIDWFVIMPRVVLLVEVKSRRLVQAAKAGDTTLPARMQEMLGRARLQLERTVDLVRSRHPAFADIPHDRPIVGLIVTAEPHYTGAAFLKLQQSTSGHDSIGVASVRDLEHVVTHEGLEDLLVGISTDATRYGWDLGREMDDRQLRPVRNPILQAAWDSYPWPKKG